jgi:hypothetical protein
LESRRKYFYIDEFQDYSPLELRIIASAYPKSVINAFGDVHQCISCKGIKSEKDIPLELFDKKFELHENYRNARQITNYVKRILNVDMLPVGLDGIQELCWSFPEISVSEDDRVAVIVSGLAELSPELYQNITFNDYRVTGEIVRGTYNIVPLEAAKGLEFEKVIVINDGMSSNELYVACTRAISELYVVNYHDLQQEDEKTDKNDKLPKIEIPAESESGNHVDKPAIISEKTDSRWKSYTLVPYTGKLVDTANARNVPAEAVQFVRNGKKKTVHFNYIEAKKEAYVARETYDIYKAQFDDMFSNNGPKDSDQHDYKTVEPIKYKIDKESSLDSQLPQLFYRDLVVNVDSTTKSVPLMNRFEGLLEGEKPYERIIFLNCSYIHKGGISGWCSYVLERTKNQDYVGDITFTSFKQGNTSDLRKHIENTITAEEFKRAIESGEMIRLKRPYLFRAQNERNLTGYGWEWDWSDPYAPVAYEGTFYGETTNYVISGIYVGNSSRSSYIGPKKKTNNRIAQLPEREIMGMKTYVSKHPDFFGYLFIVYPPKYEKEWKLSFLPIQTYVLKDENENIVKGIKLSIYIDEWRKQLLLSSNLFELYSEAIVSELLLE